MKRRAFTLVELMTVVAILAILCAILLPVFVQVKSYAHQYVAGGSMMKVGTATTMYMTDNDETFPVAFYPTPRGRQNWFGILDSKGEVIPETGLLSPYIRTKIQPDAALNAKPWQGDATGFGYNWGYLGSDSYLPYTQSTFQHCMNPAQFSTLAHPADTIEYGTSVFYFAPWIPGGDGQNYRYGFIDPPKTWFGNPTLDFRHMGQKTVDTKKRQVTSEGQALVLYGDNHLKTISQKKVKNKHFTRDEGYGEKEEPEEDGRL